ncbi:putative polyketide biosynthesis zinc-dependent hydrolase PksB [Variovorax sp. PBL-H6]|uniref:MBL fold metallo-hydrolase n=1 Tax=Variovorax sp. PBL-H6 TaxID=434009 RepID=UPI0013187D2D|nr:MBL fold metallo-hydrolase [Variovorax sp. PBL-H6]VTU31549.1 putative polyketide biosynthesis zinc-dependent hydrolase PksB [Variovorax sp. PBL-H6]
MALIFKQFVTEAIGDASYLVGDDSARVVAVIDPQVDIQQYVEAAREYGVAITHVVQTHIHEDFVSGATALAKASGGAEVCVGGHDAPSYGFEHRLVMNGQVLELGNVLLTVKHTPGHTPEHISLLVAKKDKKDAPFAVLSGGSLLVGAAGRTDLLGQERVDELTQAQFNSLRECFLSLDDGVQVYPTHVHGSPCGAAIGDKTSTTIGYERRNNELLQQADGSSFRAAALENLPPKPRYYPRIKERNTASQPREAPSTAIQPLPPANFQKAMSAGNTVVVDTRHLLAFGGAHVQGALNIGATGHLSIWSGWMLEPDQPLLLVLDSDAKLNVVAAHLARTGFELFAGYLVGGMSSWENAGLPLQTLRQLHVAEAAKESEQGLLTLLDVRSPQEWMKGHAPGARHIFLPELPSRLGELSKGQRFAVYCDSGYRASIGASLLQARGFDVGNIPGSWQAWMACELPVEKD